MLNQPLGVYPFKIKSYNAGTEGSLTLPSLFLFLQECAWDNAMQNDFGYEYLKRKNAFWVLSKVFIEIYDYPKWKDEILIKTWPKGTEGFFALRDFQVYRNEKVVANATSYWLILDLDSKRPQRLDNFNFIHENFIKDQAINKKIGKILLDEKLEELDYRKVFYSDLDVNKHVNNATYVKWILDSYLSEGEKFIEEFEINFSAELMLNDQFRVLGTAKENSATYQLKNLNDKEICKARIKEKIVQKVE